MSFIPNNAQIYLEYIHPYDKENKYNPRKLSIGMVKYNDGTYGASVNILFRQPTGRYAFQRYLRFTDEEFKYMRFLRPFVGYMFNPATKELSKTGVKEEDELFLTLWEYMYDHPDAKFFQTGDMYKGKTKVTMRNFRE